MDFNPGSIYVAKSSLKKKARSKFNDRAEENVIPLNHHKETMSEVKVKQLDFHCQTKAQIQYRTQIESKRLIFGVGAAGTGKSYVCLSVACKMLINKEINHIILTRPAVEAGESLGFLPGVVEEKWEPYFRPFRDIFLEWFGESHLEYMLKKNIIEVAPLAYIRGRTFDNAFIVLDEGQNTTPNQMKTFLTRMGKNSTVVVNGDITQKDIKGLSGLEDAIKRFGDMPDCAMTEFMINDVVRDGMVKEILKRYSK